MLAVFVGKSSRGFESGQVYDVFLTVGYVESKRKFSTTGSRCIILNTTGPEMLWCPYESFEALEHNWSIQSSTYLQLKTIIQHDSKLR